jgi:hypothetical protein
MAFNFSKGKRGFGDITFEDDSDTGIDFEPNTVKIETGGAERLVVTDTMVTMNIPLHLNPGTTEGLVITKEDTDYREIQFKTIIGGSPQDTAFIQVRADEGLVIGCQSDWDEIIFMTTMPNNNPEHAMAITADKKVGIGTLSPTAALDINFDKIRLRTKKTPSSASAAGEQGDICWDDNYMYICIGTDTWKRTTLSTW